MRKSLLVSAALVAFSIIIPTAAQAVPKESGTPPEPIKVSPQFNPLVILDCNDPLWTFQLETVAKVKSKKDGMARLKCGHPKQGYVHIRKEHKKDWTNVTRNPKLNWDDTMWSATKTVLTKPSFTIVQKGNKRCYTAPVKLKAKNGKMEEFFPTVIVSIDKRRIITSFPTREHRCAP